VLGARAVGVTLGYGAGAYLSALAFIIITVLHVIPATSKPLDIGKTDD
jgi:hypothetical protein